MGSRTFYNTESFAYAKDLTPFTALYDLAGGELRREMRTTAADLNIAFWWSSTDPAADAPILLANVPSTGSAKFTSNVTAADVLNLGGTAVTFVSTTPSGNQVLRGADASATLASLVAFLNGSADTNISKCTYRTIDDETMTALAITYKTAGTSGNNFQLTTTSAALELSSSTLTHGGTGSVEIATYEQVQDFVGSFETDLLFISGSTRVVLERETFIFEQGVTR